MEAAAAVGAAAGWACGCADEATGSATTVSANTLAHTERVLANFICLLPETSGFRPELQQTGAVEIVVSIPQQRAYIYRGGTLIGVSTVSTGMAGHRTPTGRYPIMEKRRTHFSNLYNNAPMPFMQRLTMGGIALHAGQIPGYPASHGCVRLPYEMARNLFGTTQVRSVVHIIADSPTPLTALQVARGERPAMPMEEPVRGTR